MNQLPPGFELEPMQQTNTLPPGFELETEPAAAPAQGALPPGFELAEVIPEATDRSLVDRLFVDPFRRGTDQAGMALQSGKLITNNMSVGDFLKSVDQSQFNQMLSPVHPDDQAAWEAIGSGDLGLAARTLFTNPQLLPQIIAQSLPASVPSIATGVGGGLAGGAVAGPVGAVVGGAAGAGAGSGMAEFLLSVSDAIQSSEGIVGEQQLTELLQNDEFMGKVYEHAMKRGLGVGAFDALSFGLAGKVFRPVSEAIGGGAGAASRATGAAAEVGVQSASGAAGEAAAQQLSEGQISDPGAVLVEGIAETVMGVPEIGGAVLSRAPSQPQALPEGFELEAPPAEGGRAAFENVPTSALDILMPREPEQPSGAVDPNAPRLASDPEGKPSAAQTAPAAPAVQPPVQQGPGPRTERVVTPDGQFETDVEFEVIDADALKAAEGQLQPRDRVSRVGSGEQIATIAANLDPLRLGSSRETDRGSPIIDEDGVVLSGNGRVASILLAAQNHPERYAQYRATIEQMGFQTEGMNMPVLVRRARGISPEDKRRFAVQSNTEAGLALSASERARMEQDAITAEMLAGFDTDVEGGVVAASNDGFVRQFLTNLPQSVRGSFYTADGKLSEDGARRVQNAIFARAYNDEKLIAKATETNADPAIRNALLGAAASWARMKDVAPDFDVTADLVEAISVLNDARSKGMTLPQYLAQADAFRQVSPRVQNLAGLFLNPNQTRMAAWKDIRDRLKSYAESAANSANAEGDLLGNRPGPDDTIAQINQRTQSKGADPAAQPASGPELFPQGQTLSTPPKRAKGGGKGAGGKIAAGPMLADATEGDLFSRAEGAADPVPGVEAEVTLYRGTSDGRDPLGTEGTHGGVLFMTPHEGMARAYAGKSGKVSRKRVGFKNLLDLRKNTAAGLAGIGLEGSPSHAEIAEAAREAGYDGVRYKTGLSDDEFMVFPDTLENKTGFFAGLFSDDADPAQSRKPRGTLAPTTQDVSQTKGPSKYEHAWRDAGLTPDAGTLLPPVQQRNVLSRLLQNTFGFASVVTDAPGMKLSAIEAVNQMLDAHRNVRFMMHVLALPIKAVSLDGTLNLTLERDTGRYFGVYDPSTRTIGMPGRSNSFAHEWMHALDHFLVDKLNKSPKRAYLLSQAARQEGLDVTNSVEEAFAALLNTMFYDDAALASRMLSLEQEAGKVIQQGPNKGKPTKAALEARAQIDKLLAGSSQLRILASKFRQSSKDFAPKSDYWTSVHEMLARAFEAYVGHKLFIAGGTNEFVTKGEEAYLSDADARLAMTFPKGDERVRIFAAFDEVFMHLRNQHVLGPGPIADRPDDADILDPQHWNKIVLAKGEDGFWQATKKEAFALRNAAKNLFNPKAWKDGISQIAVNAGMNQKAIPKRMLDGALDMARFTAGTTRAYINARINRNKGQGAEFLSFIWDRFAAQHGSASTHVGAVFEEKRQRAAEKIGNEIDNLLRANGLLDLMANAKTAAVDGPIIRSLMYGENPKGATAQHRAVAAGLRRIMNRVYTEGKDAGIEMGFIEDKGYLPRVLLTDRVQQEPDKFAAAAEKVYDIVYRKLTTGISANEMLRLAREVANRADPSKMAGLFATEMKAVEDALAALAKAEEAAKADPSKQGDVKTAAKALDKAVAALKAEVRQPFNEVSAHDWTQAVVAGDSATYDAHGPATDFTKTRTLPSEADNILSDWYETDPLTLTMSYAQKVTSRAAYVQAAGKSGGVNTLDAVIRRADVRAQIARNPSRFNPDTAAGRLNILRHLANPTTDNLLEIAVKEAANAGAYGPDVRAVREMIESIAGQRRGLFASQLEKLSGVAYVFTYIALLARASITGLTEPLTVMLRTGDLKATWTTFGAYLAEANRAAKSTAERAALARAIGLVSTPLYDTVLMNRLNADSADLFAGNKLMARYFRANLLSQLTNAQRRATMTGGFVWMQSMAAEWKADGKNAGRKQIIEAEFRELGVPKEALPDFVDWLTQSDDLPSLDELGTKAGKLFEHAVGRFVDQVIQNPRRADKPAMVGNPIGSVVYALTGFLYSFFSNIHAAIVKRTQRDYGLLRDAGFSRAEAAGAAGMQGLWTFTSGFALLYVGQLLVTVGREAIFNGEQFEKKRANGELEQWLMDLALSRTGIFGPGDVLKNAFDGLKYERDLSNLFTGPGPAYFLSNAQNIYRGLPGAPRNSPNTDKAEREALKSLYRLTIGPMSAGLLSAVGSAGPLSAAASFGGLTYLSSNSAAAGFANMFLGPDED